MIPIEPVKTSCKTREMLTMPQNTQNNQSELNNNAKKRLRSDISTPYKLDLQQPEGSGSARANNARGQYVSFYESGSAYGLTEKKSPTEMRNSMHLQVPAKNSQIDKLSSEAY